MSILEILEAHYVSTTHEHRVVCKTCGILTDEILLGGEQSYRLGITHQAQVLAQHEREAKADALEEAAANLARESDQFATTAERLTGHDNTRYHAYSAARQSIAHQLRNRAAQLKEPS
ncbi:hypothetical protein [Glutamicibacter protophormiae]|uniref:hypothetical protein n=1 Tax=Glutamicibacter protophormiae TaxID=37930 RepID=UPI003A8E6636